MPFLPTCCGLHPSHLITLRAALSANSFLPTRCGLRPSPFAPQIAPFDAVGIHHEKVQSRPGTCPSPRSTSASSTLDASGWAPPETKSHNWLPATSRRDGIARRARQTVSSPSRSRSNWHLGTFDRTRAIISHTQADDHLFRRHVASSCGMWQFGAAFHTRMGEMVF